MYQTTERCNYYFPITCICWAPGSDSNHIRKFNSKLANTLDAIVSNFNWIISIYKFLEYYNMPKLFYVLALGY